jgi:hypothetical protein
MSHHWPKDAQLKDLVLVPEDRECPSCDRYMHVCDHRYHRIFTLGGPVRIVSKLVHCPDRACERHHETYSSEEELGITMPFWGIGWDVFAYIGHRRFARHWSVPQIKAELSDCYEIQLSDDAVEKHIGRYRTMVAARHQDPKLLVEEYRDVKDLVLTIDGLQPEKGHEALYVVRELRKKRVWFAESLISSSAEEVKGLFEQAKGWAETLRKPVKLWISDKQDAFVTGIAEVYPGTPHRYCRNHFMRDVAKSVLEADAHAKVRMRRNIRGLRRIEREILQERRQTPSMGPAGEQAGAVTLDYCTAVRGILNGTEGGPLEPPGLRMTDALRDVRASLDRTLQTKKKGRSRPAAHASPRVSTAASTK